MVNRKIRLKNISVLLVIVLMLNILGCGKSMEDETEDTEAASTAERTTEQEQTTEEPVINVSKEGFYKPSEYRNMDYNNPNSRWNFFRSRESEHFYVFWEAGFGYDPSKTKDSDMRVDIDDLLKKAESFYDMNVNTLKFTGHEDMAESISGYKMQIYLLYQDEWLATGSGYDEKIGALWVNPSTCKPVGSTIAHEIAHSFQYMIYCNKCASGEDTNHTTGFRYGYEGSNGGNCFWEQTAQWQAYQSYPSEAFTWYHMDTWFDNYNRAFENEWQRYESYWLHYYITEKYGMDAVANIWKNSHYPEDAISCFKRIYLNDDLERLYEELYSYAAKTATFDYEAVKQYTGEYIGRYNTTLLDAGDGYKQVSYSKCPAATGFNVVPLDFSSDNTKVTVDFVGLNPGDPLASMDGGNYKAVPEGSSEVKIAGRKDTYNESSVKSGFRYGFVAMTNSGERVYSPMYSAKASVVEFNIPTDTKYLYFVVLGAPEEYVIHAWDDNEENDCQMPYKIKYEVK